MDLPDYAAEAQSVQRRAEVLTAYACRPIGQRLDRFLKSIHVAYPSWHRMMSNRAFRSNVAFADQERIRFSTTHLVDQVSDVLDVQFNLAMRGDSSATQRFLQAAGVIGNTGGKGEDDGARFVEAFAEQQAEKAESYDDAVRKEKASRDKLDEMMECVDSEHGDEPAVASMEPEG